MEVCDCFCYNKKRITIQKYQNSNTIKTREGKNMETMQGKKNIVLIGMPGAGKSTVGVVLAKRLGYRFLDSDLVIQEQTKKLLHELITEHGVDGFLKIEEDINAGLDCEQAVIATGGSVIYGEKAMEHLRKIGCVVYLKLSYKEIEDRLGDLTARGVALKNGQTLKDLYNERCPLYEKYAHIVQECDHKRVREIVQELASQANA
jgi:shikimate kinase